MGICHVKTAYEQYPEINKWKRQFDDLQLSDKVLIKLYKEFRLVDDDNSGTIQMSELLNHLNIHRTPYNERIFGLFDVDKSGYIDFCEFATALWNYCTLDKQTLALFTFELYDTDQSGVVESTEVTQILFDIYGSNFAKSKHARSIEMKLTAIGSFKCSTAAFLEFCTTHPALLFPAFEMQSAIERKCLGTGFWKRVAKVRAKNTPAKYMSVAKMTDIMSDHNANTLTEISYMSQKPFQQPSIAMRSNLKVVAVGPRTTSRRRSATAAEQAQSISEAYLRQQNSDLIEPSLNTSKCSSTTMNGSPYSVRRGSVNASSKSIGKSSPTKPRKVAVKSMRNAKVIKVSALR